jgi:hypothetical protein
MNTWTKRAAAIAALVALAFSLVGCGDQEATQRKAFIEFLQTRIIDKPGVHVPTLTPDLSDKFGLYVKHYAVITTFNSDMDQSVSGFLAKAVRVASVTSIADAVSRRDDVAAVRAQMADMRSALGQKLAAAEATSAGLTQPDDLKPIFDSAFDRVVRAPAKAFQNELPLFEDAMQSILSLADYINTHRDKLTLQGSNVTANDQKTLAAVNALLEDVNKKSALLQESQRRLIQIVKGS